MVAFNNLERISSIQINDANPELINSYENCSNYKAKLIKESQDNFMKFILGEPDNIRPGVIEYLLFFIYTCHSQFSLMYINTNKVHKPHHLV
ncbi:hypothetical protein [Clostridium estertheticum]|nr:hypothetical protein [Clostridium estertheticum]MBX4268472.1 hypothetical protein [Clostridium estertheticum]